MKRSVSEIVALAGGNSVIGRAVGVTPQAVSQWIAAESIPASKVGRVAAMAGVPIHEVRPDLFPPPQLAQAS